MKIKDRFTNYIIIRMSISRHVYTERNKDERSNVNNKATAITVYQAAT